MRHGLQAQGQHAATCRSAAPRKPQVTCSTACCPQQIMLLHARGMLSGCRQRVAKCNKHDCKESLAIWSAQLQCYDNTAATATTAQHVPQQAFRASSGMHSTLLHAQQQQVTQLLHAQAQQALQSSPLLQQQPNRAVQQMQHMSQHDGTQLCLSQAAAATVVHQRCGDVAYGQEHGHDKLHQQLCPQVPSLAQTQLDSIQPPPGELQQQQSQQMCARHQQLGQGLHMRCSHDQDGQQLQQKQQQQEDQQQRMLATKHPAQLTGWIKHSNTVQELQQLHQAHSSRFNHINIAAMLVKLAKLTCRDATGQACTVSSSSNSSSLQGVQQFALQLAQQLVSRLHECHTARQIANASWALAMLQCNVPAGLLQSAAQQLVAQGDLLLAASQPQELAMLSWGLSKLQHDPNSTLWPQLMVSVQQQLHRLTPQELTMLTWSLANVQQRQTQRWRAGTAVAPPASGSSAAASSSVQQQSHQQAPADELLLQQQNERCSSNIAAATSAAPDRPRYSSRASGSAQGSGSRSDAVASGQGSSPSGSKQQEGLFQQQLQRLLPAVCSTVSQQLQQGALQYKAKELASLLWACAVLHCRDAHLVHMLAESLQQHLRDGRCNSQDVSTSIWALGKLHMQHLQLLATAADTASTWLQQCTTQELSLLLYGCAAALQQARGTEAEAETAAAVQLWHLCADKVQHGLRIDDAGSWGLAQTATLLQAVALVLQPPERLRSRQRQQRRQQHRQPQQQGSPGESFMSSSSSMSFGSLSSISSMSGSWDAEDSSVAEVACELAAAVDRHLAAHQLQTIHATSSSSSGSSQQQYVPCILGSFAAAGLQPSQELRIALLAEAQAAAPAMNRQQLCMTAWAAAKLAPPLGSSSKVADDATVQAMEVLESVAVGKLSGMQPQQLSVLAWAHARLWNLGDSLLLHELARAALRALPRFGPQALSNLTWAFARARHYDGAFATALARRAKALVAQFSPAELANLVWGLVTLRCRQLGLLTAVASHVSENCSSWDVKACAKLAVAFASDDMPVYRFKGMFWALSEAMVAKPRGIASLTNHELSQLAGALATARVRHKGLAGHIAAVATQQLERMAVVDVVHLVWALACLNHRHDALLNAVSARVASEMGGMLVSPIKCEEECSDSSEGCSSSPHQPDVSGNSNGGSSSSLFSGRLRPQHLPRLAWAYKTLQHEDACWYMGAMRLAAEMDNASSSNSSSSSRTRSSTRTSSSSSHIRGSAPARGVHMRTVPVQLPDGAPASIPSLGLLQHSNGTSTRFGPPGHAGGRSHGGSGGNSSRRGDRGSSMHPAVLQRPVYQQPTVDAEERWMYTPPQQQ